MKMSNQDLERELASLTPHPPSGRLKAEIDRALQATGSTNTTEPVRFRHISVWAIAASLALVLSIPFLIPELNAPQFPDNLTQQSHSSPAKVSDWSYEAVEAEHILTNATDEGVVFNSENEPMRRFRYEFIDSITMVNKSDGSVFTMELPREEVLLVPVTLL